MLKMRLKITNFDALIRVFRATENVGSPSSPPPTCRFRWTFSSTFIWKHHDFASLRQRRCRRSISIKRRKHLATAVAEEQITSIQDIHWGHHTHRPWPRRRHQPRQPATTAMTRSNSHEMWTVQVTISSLRQHFWLSLTTLANRKDYYKTRKPG